MISFWKNKFLTPSEVQLSAQSKLEKNCALLYNEYNLYLRKSNILDFDDLICIPIMLLKNNQNIKDRWQKKIAYLLVDEYQDTNNSQYELIKTLTNLNSNFTLVGDDDQSIYSWRGAKPQNLFSLQEDFPNLKVIKMEQNYRSYGRILKVANTLISNNLHYFKKKLFSTLEYGNKINIIIGKNEEKEAEEVANTIIRQCSKKKIQYKDCAILYRGNYQSQMLEKILLKKNIPYKISIHASFFSRPEIKDLLSYLRLVINPDDNHAFTRIVNIPHRQIGLTTLNKLEEFSIKKNKSLFKIIDDTAIKKILKEKTINKIKNFITWIKKIIKISIFQPNDVLDIIIKDIQYEAWLSKILKEPEKIQKSINNINTLSHWLKDMLKGNEFEKPINLKEVIKKVILHDVLEKETKINKIQKNKVQLMTLHSSKGLEFSLVFIIGMNEGILPNIKSINDNNIEEERRLTYVGMTRAKKQLFLAYCESRVQYGQILNTVPSRFLFELPQEDLEWGKDIHLNNIYKKNDKNQKIKNLKNILTIKNLILDN